MRQFIEPTARNILRAQLVLGVPFAGLVLLSFATLGVFVVGGSNPIGNAAAVAVGVIGYASLRLFTRFARAGWEEALLFKVEKLVSGKSDGSLSQLVSTLALSSPDTATDLDLLSWQEALVERLRRLRPGRRLTVALRVSEEGGELCELTTEGRFNLKTLVREQKSVTEATAGLLHDTTHAYSLHTLPVTTNPLWLFNQLSRLPKSFTVVTSVKGLNSKEIKNRIEHSRRLNSASDASVQDIDAGVTFEEASHVLEGLSRGDEGLFEIGMIVLAPSELDLDEDYFCKEEDPVLAALSTIGVRKRFHRSHIVRLVTATDLVPLVFDPKEAGAAILKSIREYPLYFSPQDGRLEALHWLVVGASGSGKSFLTGLVLKRMIEQGLPMSVLFVDHNRSFRRLVRSIGAPYLEPKSFKDLLAGVGDLFPHWERSGSISGIELSDFDLTEKREAIHWLLSRVEEFLRTRGTVHPFYLVLDECWNFMRDEPISVQRAFREFRKLNGAVVAVTQSLNDFLTDESGQSIFQNAPVRILLRQGEDVSRYQGILGLNPVELSKVSRFRQEKGVFSECLIRTPFLSRVGRLHPTEAEHALLRTDNLRAELVASSQAKGSAPCTSAV